MLCLVLILYCFYFLLNSVGPKSIDRGSMHLFNILFSRSKFWGQAKLRKPIMIYLFLYYLFFLIFLVLPSCDDSDDCKGSVWTKETMKKQIKKLSEFQKNYTKVITFVLGFFVATLMRRWWRKISRLPDITSVSMVLNTLVSAKPDETEKAKKLKRTILRYCMLSYSLLMIEITRPNDKRKALIVRIQDWIWKPEPNVSVVTMKDVIDKELLTPNEQRLFEGKDLDKYWWIPMNWACKIVQANPEMIKAPKDVGTALGRYQHNLVTLLEYHLNPFPRICGQACHLGAWVYLLFSSFADQTSSGEYEWYWEFLLVSQVFWRHLKLLIQIFFQNLPLISTTIVVILFSLLRMAAICRNPFEGTTTYDAHVKEEIDVQLFIGSLALYHDTPPLQID